MAITYIITGANRGIGFELTKKLSEDKSNVVVATTRSMDRADQLRSLKRENIEIIQLDVSDSLIKVKESLGKLKVLADSGVDVFILNAGIFLNGTGSSSTELIENYSKQFEVNTISSVKFYQAIYPYWTREHAGVTKKAVYISSVLGSMGGFILQSFGYGLSKAATNFHAKHTAFEHSNSENPVLKNSISVSVHPGLVTTDMGAPAVEIYNLHDIAISPPQSAESVVKLVEGLKLEDNGAFLNYDGNKLEY